ANGRDVALSAIARDYGVDVDNVIPVEQPAEFHIDMAMSLLPGRRAYLNDSVEAGRLLRTWNEESHAEAKPKTSDPASLAAWDTKGTRMRGGLDKIDAKAGVRGRVEDHTARDLEKAGFAVIRVAARFPKAMYTPEMNFMNMEKAM